VKKENTIIFAGVSGYFLAALSVLGIALLLVSDHDQPFWFRLLWTELLVLLIYLPAFSFFKAAGSDDAHGRATIGVLPGAKIVLLIYALISFILMMLNAYHSGEYFSDKIHLAAQIVITFVMGTIFTLMSVSYTTAASGLERTFHPLTSPQELCDRVQAAEDRIKIRNLGSEWIPVTQSLKQLRETIEYSLPRVGKIGEKPEYQKFAGNIITVSEQIQDLQGNQNNIQELELKIVKLISVAKSISKQVIV